MNGIFGLRSNTEYSARVWPNKRIFGQLLGLINKRTKIGSRTVLWRIDWPAFATIRQSRKLLLATFSMISYFFIS